MQNEVWYLKKKKNYLYTNNAKFTIYKTPLHIGERSVYLTMWLYDKLKNKNKII